MVNEMLLLCNAARRGAPNTFIVGDMPQGSYEISRRLAVTNAMRFIKESAVDSVKLEGGKRVVPAIKAILDAGILVMGHLGLTPQSISSFGGYKVQGKTIKTFDSIIEDAFVLQEAGVFAILLEAMPKLSAQQISKQLSIPVYGIGAGGGVNGQLVIMHDLMGFYQQFRPWFAKCYIPVVLDDFCSYLSGLKDVKETGRKTRSDGLLKLAEMAVSKYIGDVKNNIFPGDEYSYPLKQEELDELRKSKYWKLELE